MSRGGHAKLLSAPSDAQNASQSGFSDPADVSSHGDFPEHIGRYRRDRKLGRGGMGVVYRYRDSKLDRFVAVKSLVAKGKFALDVNQRENLMREAKYLAALAHPNIGSIHDVIEHDGADYLLLEYVPGGTLAEEIRSGRLDLNRGLSVALQIGQAIQAGHEAGIVHGDIKPGNIMITPSNVAKLLDYGLARRHMRVLQPDETPGTTASIDLSAVIVGEPAMGTPGYMSPELLCGSPMHRSADIWAFGCVLYECLAGKAAFGGATPQERIAATINSQPRFEAIASGTPAFVVDLVKKCLSKAPDQRPRQMSDVCAALRAGLQPQTDAPSRSTIPSNIPAQVSSFVDRQGEIPKLLSLLDRARLLTLVGPGGCGKTRLSQELARCALQEESLRSSTGKCFDAVWFIELAALASGDLIPRAIASIVCSAESLKNKADQTLMQTIVESLRDQRMLLVLDNCEHLVDGAASCARDLLARCANLKIIATSRAGLHVQGEHVYHVPALSYPRGDSAEAAAEFESVRLFTDRARQARGGFELTDHNIAPVTEICRRLEGIPLAIELAAARVTSMPVDDLARRLFDVLDPRRVLETSIQWSVDLLSAPERTLLGRLSVFRGGWTLEAAEAVCGDGETKAIRKKSVVELLTQLVDKSLVLYEEREDRARYHMLETVREFAESMLGAAGKAFDETHLRHLDYFAALAEMADAGFSGPDEAAWLDRLDFEHDNLRSAMARSLKDHVDPIVALKLARNLQMFWCVRGFAAEGMASMEKALSRREEAADSIQISALNAAAIILRCLGRIQEAVHYCTRALEIARTIGDLNREAGVLTNLGIWARDLGNIQASREHHESSMAIYKRIDSAVGVAMVQLHLADVAKLSGRCDDARELIQECVDSFRRFGDAQREAAALQTLAELECDAGQLCDARKLLQACLRIRRRLGDRTNAAISLLWLATIDARFGSLDTAAMRLTGALENLGSQHLSAGTTDRVKFESALYEIRQRMEPDRFLLACQRGRFAGLWELVSEDCEG